MMRPDYTPEFVARFSSKIDRKDDPDACWLWNAAINGSGYGHIKHRGRLLTAHRVAYELVHGPLAPDEFALHTCDVRRCCNPAHIYAGTKSDNARDREEREGGKRRREAWYLAMELHGGAPGAKVRRPPRRFTDDEVRTIRAAYADGATCPQLAKAYDVPYETMRNIVTRKRYRHIDPPSHN